MVTIMRAIYEGDGVFRVLESPPLLFLNQEVQLEIVASELDPDWERVPRAPTAASIRQNMGFVHIDDPEVAYYLAFSLDLAIWNQSTDETLYEPTL